MLKYRNLDNSNNRRTHPDIVESTELESSLRDQLRPGQQSSEDSILEWAGYDLMMYFGSGLDRLTVATKEIASMLVGRKPRSGLFNSENRGSTALRGKQPIDLLEILESAGEVPSGTAFLGKDLEGRAISVNLNSSDNHQIVIAGGQDVGKTSLLISMLVSLAMANRQSNIQMAVVAAAGGRNRSLRKLAALRFLSFLPHMQFGVVEEAEDIAELIYFLLEEADYRLEQGVQLPLIVVAVDDVDVLSENADQMVRESLVRLLEEGPAVGIRTILTARNPDNETLFPILRNAMPIRIVGGMDDLASARAFAGIPQSGVEYIRRTGEFIAVSQGSAVHFRAAFLDDDDLHWAVTRMHRQSRPVLLARSLEREPDEGNSRSGNGDQAVWKEAGRREAAASEADSDPDTAVGDGDHSEEWQGELWEELPEDEVSGDEWDF